MVCLTLTKIIKIVFRRLLITPSWRILTCIDRLIDLLNTKKTEKRNSKTQQGEKWKKQYKQKGKIKQFVFKRTTKTQCVLRGGRTKDYTRNLLRSKLARRALKQLTDCETIIQSGKEFQTVTVRFQKRLESRLEVQWDLIKRLEFPRVRWFWLLTKNCVASTSRRPCKIL